MEKAPGFTKYEYTTVHKQRVVYRFKPKADRTFCRALDLAVEQRIGTTPGKYTVLVDRPVGRDVITGTLVVYLQIKQKDELSAESLTIYGWSYEDD